jgi:hypothetical protein
MKINFLIIGIVFIFIFSLLLPQYIYGQGTFDCQWKQRGRGGQWYCGIENNCHPNYEADLNYCSTFSESECNNVKNLTCLSPGEEYLCCPLEFSDTCPLDVNQDIKCCRRHGFSNYEIIDKVVCGESITGYYCCPEGYGTGDADCPFSADRTKECCKRLGIREYETIGKILCTLTTTQSKIIKLLTPTPCGGCVEERPDGSCVRQYGIETILGCFPTASVDIVSWILRRAIMFAGAAAFLLMIFGSFQIILSSGDPEKIKKGQEILTAAIAGLLLIIFSVFLLRLIGVTILAIPGWS